MQHDLTILRKLRNDFAHSPLTLKLAEGELSKRSRALKMDTDLSETVMKECATIERQKLLKSTTSIMLHLSVLIQRGIIEREVLQRNFSEINKKTQDGMRQVRETAAAKNAIAT